MISRPEIMIPTNEPNDPQCGLQIIPPENVNGMEFDFSDLFYFFFFVTFTFNLYFSILLSIVFFLLIDLIYFKLFLSSVLVSYIL